MRCNVNSFYVLHSTQRRQGTVPWRQETVKELLKENGEEYKFNFKYSILEVCNMNLGSGYIIEREAHWKEVLLTRKFGLNKN